VTSRRGTTLGGNGATLSSHHHGREAAALQPLPVLHNEKLELHLFIKYLFYLFVCCIGQHKLEVRMRGQHGGEPGTSLEIQQSSI
jgi:hypothetical protein